jgi:hypothetical protein
LELTRRPRCLQDLAARGSSSALMRVDLVRSGVFLRPR